MPKLSIDTFMAALTIASLAACSKAAPSSASVSPEPAASTPAATATAAATSVASAAPAPAVADESVGRTAVIDAGIEHKKAVAPGARPKATANAGCGAGTCSDDMKK